MLRRLEGGSQLSSLTFPLRAMQRLVRGLQLGPLGHGLRRVAGTGVERAVTLRWPDGREVGAFLPKFLRENTIEAWDGSSKQRLDFCLPLDLQVRDVAPVEFSSPDYSGPAFRLQFSDGHLGHFTPPRPADTMWSNELRRQEKLLWGSEEAAQVRGELRDGHGPLRFEWKDLQENPSVAKRWIEAMHSHGLALVAGLPSSEDKPFEGVHAFARSLGTFLAPSVYGETFQIKSVASPNNLAYSSLGLQMHTDLPFNEQPPGIQLFHCLQQAEEGGESIAMDGFAAAESLRQQDPEAFQTLCEHPIGFQDVTKDWFLSAKHPTFELDGAASADTASKLRRLNFNERARDSWRHWNPAASLQQEERVYEAMRKFEELVEDRSRYVSLRLMPGEMICTDNWRVMHSRSSFLGSRYFVGAYLDWDAVRGRWRSLSNTFQAQWRDIASTR